MKKVDETTIQDIAKSAGVSKATVSAVLNSKNTARPSTREKILQVAEALHYHPKTMVGIPKYGDAERVIGIIVKELNYPFYTTIAEGATEYANSKGYSLIVASSDYNHEREKKFTRLFSAKGIKGTIIAPLIEGNSEIEHLLKLQMSKYPFVLLAEKYISKRCRDRQHQGNQKSGAIFSKYRS